MIDVHELTVTYPGAKEAAVRGVDFQVSEGEIFGFLGPSGAGKSTTQNVLTGLLRHWHGQVEVMGRPLRDWGREYYERVSASFELPNHYPRLTARQNLDFFRRLYTGSTSSPEEVMARVGLAEVLDVPVENFSKGMKNRLTLARSLLNQPTLWFLDEPTAGLDPVNAAIIRELIAERRSEGVTVVLTTHDMTVADVLCDRVAFLVDGQIAECDPPEELKRRYGVREVHVDYGEADAPKRAVFSLDGLGDDPQWRSLFEQHPILRMHSQECSLEEVFIKVTGRRLS